MEGINQDDVIQILRMLDESNFEELRLEMGGVKLAVSKSGKKAKDPERLKMGDPGSDAWKPSAEPAITKTEKKPEMENLAELETGDFIAIKAPMLGTFYRGPKPGAPPFVEVGQRIAENDSLCIIEVMKLFNTVKANLRGEIVKICAENGKMVEYQQTLFLVKPLGDDEKIDGESVS